jgi:hypothetical protein
MSLRLPLAVGTVTTGGGARERECCLLVLNLVTFFPPTKGRTVTEPLADKGLPGSPYSQHGIL